MIARVLTLAGGLSGAAGLSQYPEFSQQYAQRLGGAVDELHQFVADFDADAASVGASREEALTQLAQGGAIGEARAETMTTTIDRYERLKSALDQLEGAGPFTRAYKAGHINDPEIVKAAWTAFKPAVPLSFEGLIFTGVGFLGGILALSLVFGLLKMLFGRRKPAEMQG